MNPNLNTKVKIILGIETVVVVILVIALIVINSTSDCGDPHANDGHSSLLQVSERVFGHTSKHDIVKLYTLKYGADFIVELISFGAAIKSVHAKCKHGHLNNRVLGFDTIEEYENQTLNPYFGSIVGRVTARISNGQFNLNDVVYNLDKNNGKHTLHGGKTGFSWKNWESKRVRDGVKFFLTSQDGDGGFPGRVYVEVTYTVRAHLTVKNKFELSIEYFANTTSETPIDLTNHVYFNLNTQKSKKKIYNHLVKINAENYLDFDPVTVLATGNVNPIVPNSKNDFRDWIKLADRIVANGTYPQTGYDDYFIVNQATGRKAVASVRNPENGINIDVFSDQNGVIFYTGNGLNLTKPSTGDTYSIHDGFTLETCNYPDAVNKKNFPSSIVKPNGLYIQRTSYVFYPDPEH